jgi:hypothetical protein
MRRPALGPFDQRIQWGAAPGSFLVLCTHGYARFSLSTFSSHSDLAVLDLCAAIISEGSESVVLSLKSWLPPGESLQILPDSFNRREPRTYGQTTLCILRLKCATLHGRIYKEFEKTFVATTMSLSRTVDVSYGRSFRTGGEIDLLNFLNSNFPNNMTVSKALHSFLFSTLPHVPFHQINCITRDVFFYSRYVHRRSILYNSVRSAPKYGMPKEFVEFRPRMNIMAVLIMQFSPLGRWEIAQPPGGTQRSY